MRTHLPPLQARAAHRFTSRAAPLVLAFSLWLAPLGSARAQSLIEGVDSWADATVGLSTAKWVGPRVDFPEPRDRPASLGRIDSPMWPLSVHVTRGVSPARAQTVLAALEQSYALLAHTGWVEHFGDGGQGDTGGHDLYLVAQAERGASAAIDATEPLWAYDGARAFALLDARVPARNVRVCATQALVEALLYELDPAEAASVRVSSAAYVAWLVTGELGCDDDAERALDEPARAPFAPGAHGRGASWLGRLEARQTGGTGTFLRDMWQFARQRTWEGQGLRASPDLFACMEKALELRHEKLEDVAAELSDQRVLEGPPFGLAPHAHGARISWEQLPEHLPPADPPLETLGASYVMVELGKPRPHERLRVWSRGELGTRWALSVTRLDGQGAPVGRVSAPPRKNPSSYVIVELDARTTQLLVSLTNVAGGVPDADLPEDFYVHGAMLIVDRGATTPSAQASGDLR